MFLTRFTLPSQLPCKSRFSSDVQLNGCGHHIERMCESILPATWTLFFASPISRLKTCGRCAKATLETLSFQIGEYN